MEITFIHLSHYKYTFYFRFRKGYCRHNPRKMVRLWAEKELRNLTRMFNVGLPVPEPKVLKSHVLLMDFIGKEGWPAPKLKVRNLIYKYICLNIIQSYLLV